MVFVWQLPQAAVACSTGSGSSRRPGRRQRNIRRGRRVFFKSHAEHLVVQGDASGNRIRIETGIVQPQERDLHEEADARGVQRSLLDSARYLGDPIQARELRAHEDPPGSQDGAQPLAVAEDRIEELLGDLRQLQPRWRQGRRRREGAILVEPVELAVKVEHDGGGPLRFEHGPRGLFDSVGRVEAAGGGHVEQSVARRGPVQRERKFRGDLVSVQCLPRRTELGSIEELG